MSRARSLPLLIARHDDLVVEGDPRRVSGRLLRDGGMDASYVDLADPAHLEFDYMRWLRLVLRALRARRIVHVGGGACALARALAAEDPGGRQEVCELNAEVIALAREHLGLRRRPGLRRSPRCARANAITSAFSSHTSWCPPGSSAASARAKAQAPPPT